MNFRRKIPKAQRGIQTAQAQNIKPGAVIQAATLPQQPAPVAPVAQPVPAAQPVIAGPELGSSFRPNQGGNHKVMFNDPASKRSLIRDSKGNYFLTGYDDISKSGRGVRMKSTPMTAQEAQYFMRNTDTGKRYYSDTAGDHLAGEAKHEQKILERGPGSYHASGQAALTFKKRKGGIMYRSEDI